MTRFFFLLLFGMAGMMAHAQYANDEPFAFEDNGRLVMEIEQDASLFIDSTSSTSIDKISPEAFKPLTHFYFKTKIPRKLVEKKFYLRFHFTNLDNKASQFYFFPGMHYRRLELYRVHENGQIEKDTASTNHNGFVPFTLEPGRKGTYILQMLFSKNDNNQIHAHVIKREYLKDYLHQLSTRAYDRKMTGFIFSGALLLMLLFSLVNYSINWKPEFIYNALYCLCMFLIAFIFAYFNNTPGKFFGLFYSYLWLILLNTGFIFYIQFTRNFINTATQYPLIDKLFKAEMLILFLLSVVYSIVHFTDGYARWDSYLENAMKVTVIGMSFIYIILGLENRNRLINYLALGNAAQVIFALIALSMIPVTSSTYSLFNSALFYFEVGVVVSQVFFLLGLAHKNRTDLIDEIKFRETIRLNEEKNAFETKLAIMEAKQAERNRISADMHDDLGSGMTSIRLYSELAKKKLAGFVMPELDKISTSANELLVKMNAIIWSMAGSNDSLDNTIAYIRSFALDYMENTGIRCQVSIAERLPAFQLPGEMRRNIFMIVKECLNNIVKHSGATEVHISLQKEPEGLSLTIRDNGKGIDFDKVSEFGNGLKNMKKRMEDLGGELTIKNHNGTTVRLYKKTR